MRSQRANRKSSVIFYFLTSNDHRLSEWSFSFSINWAREMV